MADGINIYVKVDTRDLVRALSGAEKQIPYAIALALTRTAQDAEKALEANLPEHFTVRSGWLKKGIRIERAEKTNLTATVGSVDPFMETQAVGGERLSGGKTPAVPQVGKGLPRPTLKGTTRPSKWPGAMKEKGKTFIGSPFGHENEGVWERVVKGKGKNRQEGIRLLYVLAPEVQVPARWPIEKEVGAVVKARWAIHTMEAVDRALSTAKR